MYAVINTAKEDGRLEAEEEYEKILEKERKEKEKALKIAEEAKKREEEARKEKREMAIKTAKVMKANGIDIDTIVATTGLSRDEIEKL